MSHTREHYHDAARHHQRAAYHYQEAAKYSEAEDLEKAARHAFFAHEYVQHAAQHDARIAELHAKQWGKAVTPDSGQDAADEDAGGAPRLFVSKPC